MQAYEEQLKAAGMPYGVVGDPYGDWLGGQAKEAQDRYQRQSLNPRRGESVSKFLATSQYSPESLRQRYQATLPPTPRGNVNNIPTPFVPPVRQTIGDPPNAFVPPTPRGNVNNIPNPMLPKPPPSPGPIPPLIPQQQISDPASYRRGGDGRGGGGGGPGGGGGGNTPFADRYANQMEEAFADSYGTEGDPFGDYVAGMSDEAKAAWRNRKQHHPGLTREEFFEKSAYAPERLQAQYETYGGGSPMKEGRGNWDRRPDKGDARPPVDPGSDFTPPPGWEAGPIGGGPGGGKGDPLNDIWREKYEREASWQKHMTDQGFNRAGATNFDDWRRGLFRQAELDWEEQRKSRPGSGPGELFPQFLRDQYGNAQALRNRFFSMAPGRRGASSSRFRAPGRTVAY